MTREHASERRSREGRRKPRALIFFPRILLPRLVLRAARARSWAVEVFIVVRDGCIVIIMAHADNSKRTHTPKGICQVLASPMTLDI